MTSQVDGITDQSLININITKEDLDDIEKFTNKARIKYQVFGINKDKELYLVLKDENPWLKFTIHTDGKRITKVVRCDKRQPCEHDLNPHKWITVWKRGIFK